MQPKRNGIYRYLQPKLYPIHGIGVGYIIMWIIRLTTDITPHLYKLFYIGTHYVTLADILLVTGLIVGIILWRIKS